MLPPVSRLVCALAAVIAVGAFAAVALADSQQAARVVDRTYLCRVAPHNGVRRIEARAQRGFREDGRWRWLSSAGVSNENGGPPAKLPPTPTGQIPIYYTNWGFGVSAGLELAHPEPSPPLRPYRAGLSVTSRRACTATRARVPLSRRGLDGFPADYFGDEVECASPAKVLVRVRAVFAEPASLQIDRSQGELRTRRASGAVREAALAVRTTSGRPLLYASTSAAGAARLFSAAGCSPT
jgi:hypothetical protein